MESAIIHGYVPPGKSLVQHRSSAVIVAIAVVLSPPFFTSLMLGDTHVKDRG